MVSKEKLPKSGKNESLYKMFAHYLQIDTVFTGSEAAIPSGIISQTKTVQNPIQPGECPIHNSSKLKNKNSF